MITRVIGAASVCRHIATVEAAIRQWGKTARISVPITDGSRASAMRAEACRTSD